MGSSQAKHIQPQKVVAQKPKTGGAISKPKALPKPMLKKQVEIKAMGSFYGSYAPLTLQASPKR
jgi:hypothetical protein